MKKLMLASVAVAAMLVPQAHAETYQATNWMTNVHILNSEPYQKFAEELQAATDGGITFEVYSGGSLVPARTTMQAIRDGVASLGIVYPGYTPSELPLNNVLNDLVFTSSDAMAAAFAYTEIGLTNDKLIEEWSKNGGIFAGGYATPVYNFICVSPIETLADANGLKIRTAGGAQTDWVQSIGGVPVSVPIGDVYSGLSRGSLDCTMSDPTNLAKGNKFWEVADSVTMLPMGVVLGATYVLNPSFWQGLDEEQRRMLLDNMAAGLARSQVTYANDVDAALEGSKQRGLEIIEPSEDLQQTLAEFQQSFVEELPENAVAERSVEDPSAVIEEFQALEAKWRELLADVDRDDPEAIAELLRTEIYDKIDVAEFASN